MNKPLRYEPQHSVDLESQSPANSDDLEKLVSAMQDRLQRPLVVFLKKLNVNPSDCEDVIQHVLVKLVQIQKTGRLKAETVAGLAFRIARCKVIDDYRKSSRRIQVDESIDHDMLLHIAASEPDGDHEFRCEFLDRHLDRVLKNVRGIGKDVTEVLLLHWRDGLTMLEIGQELKSRNRQHKQRQIKRAHAYVLKRLRDSVRSELRKNETK